MNTNRIINISVLACIAGSVVAQVVPVLYCCKYNYQFSGHPGGSPCGAGTTTVTICETSSSGTSTSDPNALKERDGIRNATCTEFDIGVSGSWANIPCESEPPLGGVFVGELEDGSCCYAVPGAAPIDATVSNIPQLKVQKCSGGCEGGGVH